MFSMIRIVLAILSLAFFAVLVGLGWAIVGNSGILFALLLWSGLLCWMLFLSEFWQWNAPSHGNMLRGSARMWLIPMFVVEAILLYCWL